MFFDDKTKLHAKLGKNDDAELEKDLCKKFRISLVEEDKKDTHIFLSECMLLLSDTNKVILYNNLNKFESYKVPKLKHFHDLSIEAILAGTKETDKKNTIVFGDD